MQAAKNKKSTHTKQTTRQSTSTLIPGFSHDAHSTKLVVACERSPRTLSTPWQISPAFFAASRGRAWPPKAALGNATSFFDPDSCSPTQSEACAMILHPPGCAPVDVVVVTSAYHLPRAWILATLVLGSAGLSFHMAVACLN